MMRRFTAASAVLALSLLFSFATALAQPQVSYIIPDIGAREMNTYVEIVAPTGANGAFGTDGFYLNNPGDPVRVFPQNIADTARVVVGPIIVSWNGRMISTHVFVKKNAVLGVVPLQIQTSAGSTVTNEFEIKTPIPNVTVTPGARFNERELDIRSKRGAAIVESITFNAGTYPVAHRDLVGGLSGNESYYPVIIIARKSATINSGATVDVSASGKDGGAGGGGGGGQVCDRTLLGNGGNGNDGGNGYTGGGAGGQNDSRPGGSSSFRSIGLSTGTAGDALNGTDGGTNSSCYEGAGGGTGHPFGKGGEGWCGSGSPVGAYGGASTGGQNGAGGGGGFAVDGTNGGGNGASANRGRAVGNEQLVPVAGGSGGASGNPQEVSGGCGGAGGGGGGAFILYAMDSLVITGGTVKADGTNGASGVRTSGGGGGSGGAIILGARRNGSLTATLSVRGGTGTSSGGNGAVGRFRYDGPPSAIPGVTAGATSYIGPTTDTTSYSDGTTFTLKGTAPNGPQVKLYIRSDDTPWREEVSMTAVNGRWTHTITVPKSGMWYIVAAQQVPSPNGGTYTDPPEWVFSQVAANIVTVTSAPRYEEIDPPDTDFGVVSCPQDSLFSLLIFRNSGTENLTVSATLAGVNSADFALVEPGNVGSGITVAPGQTDTIRIRFAPSLPGAFQRDAQIIVRTNDPRPGFDRIPYDITGHFASAIVDVERDTIDFGQICIGENKLDTVRVNYTIQRNAQIIGVTATAGEPFFKVPAATPLPITFPYIGVDGETVTGEVDITPVRFRPVRAGVFLDSIILTDDCNDQHVVYLRGEGIQITIEFVPEYTTTPRPNLDFGRVPLNFPKTLKVRIRNVGKSPARISNPSIPTVGSAFSFDPATLAGEIILPDSGFVETDITFEPTEEKAYRDSLVFMIDGPCGGRKTLFLDGIGVRTNLVFDPDSLILAADSCSTDPDPVVTGSVKVKNLGSLGVRLVEGFSRLGKVQVTTVPALPTSIGPAVTNQEVEVRVSWRPNGNPPGTDSVAIVALDTISGMRDTIWLPVTLQLQRAIIRLRTSDGRELSSDSLEILDLGSAYGCNTVVDTLEIINAGELQGVITGGFPGGSAFSVNPTPPFQMNVGESKRLIVTFNPTRLGAYEDTLVLQNGICNIEWKIVVRGHRYDLKIDATPNPIDFGLTNTNFSRVATVRFTNNSDDGLGNMAPDSVVIDRVTVQPGSMSPPFTVTAADLPLEISAGGFDTVQVTFDPSAEQAYDAQLCYHIVYPCDTTICIDMSGEGIESNIFTPRANLDFGQVYPCDEDTLFVPVFSVGPDPLNIIDVDITGADRAAFAFDVTYPRPFNRPYTMRPGIPVVLDSMIVAVRFVPGAVTGDGPKNAMLVVVSDDPKQDTLFLPLTGERVTPSVTGPLLVDFGTVVVGRTGAQQVPLTNNSNDTITITNATVVDPFRILTVGPIVIPPRGTVNVDVEFAPDDARTYEDTIRGSFTTPCGGPVAVALIGEGLRGATIVSIPNWVAGEPGERVSIPVVLEQAQNMADVGATTLRAKIRYNRSLLFIDGVRAVPGAPKLAANNATIVDTEVDGEEEVLTVDFMHDPVPVAPDTLGWIDATALLGNDTTTPIAFDTAFWTDGEVLVETVDGLFTLEGYCMIGDNRLIRVEGTFGIKSATPNPFGEVTEITFETVENGRTTLEVYDALGEKVITLVDRPDLPVQAHAALWNAKEAPSGVYYAILRTPTQTSVARLVIVR